MKFLKKIFGIGSKTQEMTLEEKIAKAEKKYSGMDLVSEILKIEGVRGGENEYYRMIDLCAEYGVDFPFPN